MPFLLLLGAGALGVGGGVKLAGDGVDSAGGGAMKVVVAAAVFATIYYYAKKGA
jgi:hypothetical protein